MVNEIIDMDSIQAAFLRAAGGESSIPVVTPSGLADKSRRVFRALIKPKYGTTKKQHSNVAGCCFFVVGKGSLWFI
jgi:hypothetical protein